MQKILTVPVEMWNDVNVPRTPLGDANNRLLKAREELDWAWRVHDQRTEGMAPEDPDRSFYRAFVAAYERYLHTALDEYKAAFEDAHGKREWQSNVG